MTSDNLAMHNLRALFIASIIVATTVPFGNRSEAAAPAATSQAAPNHIGVDPAVEAKAKERFDRFQRGDIDRSQLDARCNAELTDDMILAEAARLKPLGKPASFTFASSEPIHGVTGYDFLLDFGDTRIAESIAFDADGKITGIDFRIYVRNR